MPKPILFHFIYELGLACLLMLVLFLPIPHALDQTLSIGIWVILVVDFGTRFILAEKKGLFFRRHILEFVAILPFGFFFQSIRLIRVIQMLRTVFLVHRHIQVMDRWMTRYRLDVIFRTILFLMIGSAVLMRWIEPEFTTYGDAFWWAIVTMTTVGYGDLAPVTPFGRVVASLLMLTGIGLIGVITGAYASLFTEEVSHSSLPPELKEVREALANYKNLKSEDYNQLIQKIRNLEARVNVEE